MTTMNGQRHDRTVLVLYGSETGNSQDIAEELGRLTERLHFSTTVADLDATGLNELLKPTIVLFVISTTGQGDVPANARKFWKSLLRKRLPPGCLGHVKFTTFGLGDSSYPKFNWAARKLHKRLEQLGAKEIYPRGEADEQHEDGNDGAFLPWSIDFRKTLLEKFPLPEGVIPIPDDVLLPSKWELEAIENVTELPPDSQDMPKSEDIHLPIPNSHLATLDSNIRVTAPGHWQDVRELTFTLPSKVEYSPGDILSIYPQNHPSDVSEIIELMDWQPHAHKSVQFIPTTDPSTIDQHALPYLLEPPNLTLHTLLTHYFDITAIPSRYFFFQLSHYTPDEMHRERLLEFANPLFRDELYNYTSRPRRSILEVLLDFPTVKIPWQKAASVFPLLRHRQFSIASGGSLKSNPSAPDTTRIQLLVAIVKYQTILRKIRQGVCTRYLSGLKPGATLTVTLTKGNMGNTADKSIIMIAPGTGLAPMRSLIWERNMLPSPPGAILFFGGRSARADYFYADDWTGTPDDGRALPVEVFTAFSRDQREKIYVQDVVRRESARVYEVLGSGGVVYVCGSSGAMPKAIREALISVFEKEGGLEREEAEGKVVELEKEGRYKLEVW